MKKRVTICRIVSLVAMAVMGGNLLRAEGKSASPEPTPGKETKETAAPKPGDALFFLNRDVLHGKLISIDPAGGINWQSTAATQPVEFKVVNVAEIRLDG